MKLFVSRAAVKQLLKIPYKFRVRIEALIERLVKNPFPRSARKLSGRPGYRLRIGDYRVLYYVDKRRKRIVVLSVAHRKDA